MPCRIHNPGPEPITLPAPLTGILRGGQSFVVSASVAAVASVLGPSPLQLSTPPEAVSAGQADDWVLGFAAGLPTAGLADGAVTALKLGAPMGAAADNTGEFGTAVVLRRTITAGVGGTPDDIPATEHTPFGLKIVDIILHVETAGAGGSTLTVRTASGGGGDALSSALSTAATGVVRSVLTTAASVADGAAIYLRRTDNTVAGFVDFVCIRA